jgi:hypothetical protein
MWHRKLAFSAVFVLIVLSSGAMLGQDAGTQDAGINDFSIKPVPVLTGSTGYITTVNGGRYQDAPSVSPLLLVPFGDRWLIEAKGGASDTFTKNALGNYTGKVSYGLGYAQVDYITRYATVTAGRFVTPFGIYAERYAPNWIRNLQLTPMSVLIPSLGSLGGMLRGGFPAGTEKVNLNYAAYFSANNTNHIVATNRSTGGRISFFLPGPRLEFGASFQQILQDDRAHSVGVHFVWQPNAFPMSLRSEYVRSSGTRGSGYWIESAYRLSQISFLKKLELVGRGQQFFAAPNLAPSVVAKLGALGKDTNQADFGLNYYFRSDVRATASYGRQFVLGRNTNLWTIGMTYRFVMPMWPSGGAL